MVGQQHPPPQARLAFAGSGALGDGSPSGRISATTCPRRVLTHPRPRRRPHLGRRDKNTGLPLRRRKAAATGLAGGGPLCFIGAPATVASLLPMPVLAEPGYRILAALAPRLGCLLRP